MLLFLIQESFEVECLEFFNRVCVDKDTRNKELQEATRDYLADNIGESLLIQ